ncbi:PepSY domain-containing protein [Fertoebacter nigrum]|uniref:PepSY domain-containing protein n=1 Tax=Fertoeibacter niger TaxID=2656921 RepID=A0A8X8KN51_9RHOB|nr:PepSY domain-containing protein [Fertoeibacter niger]NUB44630.1 PepSY domain-containing protein [Fertoeibacter niger]
MSNAQTQDLRPATAAGQANKLYFAAWRWHFYAGLYVAPFLMMLAVTGLIMLWTATLSGMNGERTVVAPGPALPVSQQAAAAAANGGTVTQYIAPLADDRVAVFRVEAGDTATAVLVDPATATVVDTLPWRAGLYDFATDIHGTLLLGTTGDRLIEVAAGLAMVLIVTGLYLWWPRGGKGWRAMLVPQLGARGRALWKSLHQSIGFWMSALLLVFLLSGLSWAGIWGEKLVQAWSTFPAEKWENVPVSDDVHASMNHGAAKEVPWGLEQTPLPASGSDAGVTGLPDGSPVTLDTVAGFAATLGFDGRFQLNLPKDEAGVWTISHDSMSNDGPDPSADRTIHLDQYTGKVLADVGYADYSVYAKAMAYGIAFHEGDMGLWNLVLNTVFCLSVIFMAVSGLVMWWKRRPAGALRLAAPPLPVDLPLWKGAVFLALALSLAFPLVGITLLAVLAFDLAVLANVPRLKRALS